jgi:CO/xanthine dehydrogenase FAD-binding subunit
MAEAYSLPEACAYEAPHTLAEATRILAHYGQTARVLAGGTDLIIAMRDKGVRPACLIDIKRIPELQEFAWAADGALVVGAAVPMVSLLRSERFRRECEMLCVAMETVGSYQLRTRATLGGNICNASPAADTAPPMIAMGAEVVITGVDSTRTVPLEAFFTGPGRHLLARGELVTAVRFPAWSLSGRGVYLKQGRRQAMELAIVGVAAFRPARETGLFIRLAVASVAPKPLRLTATEAVLRVEGCNQIGITAAVKAALGEVSPISDVRASAAYRRQLVKVLVRRALEAVMEGDTE